MFQIDVFADDAAPASYPVELTFAQTLALYGDSINALYYNGSSVENATFTFWKSSRSVVSSLNDCFDNTFPFISGSSINNPIAFDYYYSSNNLPRLRCVPRSVNASDLSSWISASGATKSDLCPYEFLIYRWQGDPYYVPDSSFDFEFNFNFPIDIVGVDRLRTAFGVSMGTWSGPNSVNEYHMSGYIDQLNIYANNDAVNPYYIMTPFVYSLTAPDDSPYLCFPVTNGYDGLTANLGTNYYNQAVFPCPNVSMCCVDTDGLQPFTWSSASYNVRAASSSSVKMDGFENPGSSGYQQYWQHYVYLFIMCPVIWGDITLPEPEAPSISDQLEGIGTGINDINVNINTTNTKLDAVLQKLDQIYQKNYASDLTQNGPLSWIGTKIDNVADSVVSGIRGLFVPSQIDLINFRLNLQNDFQTHFPAFFTAEEKLHNLYSIFDNSVTPRSKISVPLVEMSIPDVSNNTSADFSFGGFDVELKPNQDKLGILYDSLALIIDFIATLAVLNMLRNKLHRILEGSASE